jgi:hypothetical protein
MSCGLVRRLLHDCDEVGVGVAAGLSAGCGGSCVVEVCDSYLIA